MPVCITSSVVNEIICEDQLTLNEAKSQYEESFIDEDKSFQQDINPAWEDAENTDWKELNLLCIQFF
jgi:hypothetical protein